MQIFNHIIDLVISMGRSTKETKREVKTRLVIVEAKMRKF